MSRKPVILALDSSGPVLRVGVRCGEGTWTSRKKGIKQEQFILPLVQQVLAKAGAQLSDIKQIFFVRGPGRFTGIRISLTLASMLQHLNGTKVSSATLFEILYQQALQSAVYRRWKTAHETGACAVVLHAFREEYFLQIFDRKAQGPQWLSKEDLQKQLSAYKEPLYLAGTDKEEGPLEDLTVGWAGKYAFAPKKDCLVQMNTLLQMVENPQYEKDALEPLYLKPARFELGK